MTMKLVPQPRAESRLDTNTSVTISSTIPADIVEGGYYLYVVADQDDLILERDEDNNQQTRRVNSLLEMQKPPAQLKMMQEWVAMLPTTQQVLSI